MNFKESQEFIDNNFNETNTLDKMGTSFDNRNQAKLPKNLSLKSDIKNLLKVEQTESKAGMSPREHGLFSPKIMHKSSMS